MNQNKSYLPIHTPLHCLHTMIPPLTLTTSTKIIHKSVKRRRRACVSSSISFTARSRKSRNHSPSISQKTGKGPTKTQPVRLRISITSLPSPRTNPTSYSQTSKAIHGTLGFPSFQIRVTVRRGSFITCAVIRQDSVIRSILLCIYRFVLLLAISPVLRTYTILEQTEQ